MRELVASAYKASSAVKLFNAVPRFGHTSVITSIFDANNEVDTDAVIEYARGTVFIAGFCLTTVILWILVLMVLKCFRQRAGIAAGYPFENNMRYGTAPKKHSFVRGLLLLSSIFVMCTGIVFLVTGTASLQRSFDDIRNGASGLTDIADDIVSTTNELIAFGEGAGGIKNSIVTMIEDGVCGAVDEQAGLPTQSDAVQEEFDKAANTVVAALEELEDFSRGELTNLRNTFEAKFDSVMNNVTEGLDKGEEEAQPMYIAAPIFVFGFILSVGTIMAWRGWNIRPYFCMQTWLILPLFAIIVIFTSLALSLVGTVLVINSDVCLGGESKTPEGTVQILFDKLGGNDIAREAVNFYVINGCVGDFTSLVDVETLLGGLNDVLVGVIEMKEMLESEQADLEIICGGTPGSLDNAKSLLDKSVGEFDTFVAITNKARDVLDCPRINGIFVDFTHDALCTNIPGTFAWIFSTMATVFVLGMGIILLRGALLPSKDNSTHPDDDSNIDEYGVPVYKDNGKDYQEIPEVPTYTSSYESSPNKDGVEAAIVPSATATPSEDDDRTIRATVY